MHTYISYVFIEILQLFIDYNIGINLDFTHGSSRLLGVDGAITTAVCFYIWAFRLGVCGGFVGIQLKRNIDEEEEE